MQLFAACFDLLPICAIDAWRSALLRHEARVQRLETRVDGRTHDDAKAQVLSRPLVQLPSTLDPSRPPPRPALCILKSTSNPNLLFLLLCQATLHRVLRHLVLHRHRLAAIEEALARDRAAAAAAERKLGQALSVQPTIDMSYKQTAMQQHQLASTIDNFASQVHPSSVIRSVEYCCSAAGSTIRPSLISLHCRRARSTPQRLRLPQVLRTSRKAT